MRCWYCGEYLEETAYEVPGLLGFYCYRCALKLCDEKCEPVEIDIEELIESEA